MKIPQFPLFAIIILVTGLILYLVYGGLLKQTKNTKKLVKNGNRAMADVISVSQINLKENSVTQLLLQVELKNAGGQARRVEIRQPVDHGAIPRVGDRVYVIVDPKDPNNVMLAPVPGGSIGND